LFIGTAVRTSCLLSFNLFRVLNVGALLNVVGAASTSISKEGSYVQKNVYSAFPAKLCNLDFNPYIKHKISLHNFLRSKNQILFAQVNLLNRLFKSCRVNWILCPNSHAHGFGLNKWPIKEALTK
jgi:hypothetical protein